MVLTERFSDFFVEKVDKIAQSFSDVELVQTTVVRNHPVFDEFVALSPNDVSKLRRLKCSELDVLPTDAFKSVWPLIVPYVTVLLNLSFSQGVFPSRLKLSLTKPILKNSIMDFNSRKSYRPVSNLTFISKLIETAAKTELLAHFSKYDLLHSNQSAYRPGHSVETTLLDVYSSILLALDSGKSCFLVLLDLSAAFDTISHSRLLSILESSFGITGQALSWIKSYLAGRSFKIKAKSSFSSVIRGVL